MIWQYLDSASNNYLLYMHMFLIYAEGGTNSRTVVIIVFSIILFFLLVSSAYVLLRKRKAKQDTQDNKSNQGRNCKLIIFIVSFRYQYIQAIVTNSGLKAAEFVQSCFSWKNVIS